jgi:CubicO group peptidase (beta-lactamase class C family)
VAPTDNGERTLDAWNCEREALNAEEGDVTQLRPGDPEEVGMSARQVRRVAGLAGGWVRQGITPALVVLAARKGVVVLHEAFGRLRPEADAPPLPLDAIYPLASITKPITATAVMCLVEDGLLGLNSPVQEYLPEFVGEGTDQVMATDGSASSPGKINRWFSVGGAGRTFGTFLTSPSERAPAARCPTFPTATSSLARSSSA